LLDRGINWKPLPGTQEEVDNINSLFLKNGYSSVKYTGIIALEEQIKYLGKQSAPEILHIASHGFFLPDSKENLGMVANDLATIFMKGNPLLVLSGQARQSLRRSAVADIKKEKESAPDYEINKVKTQIKEMKESYKSTYGEDYMDYLDNSSDYEKLTEKLIDLREKKALENNP
jgi:hypothetical protein